MTIVRYGNYVFDAKKFLYAEVTGTSLNIYLEGTKKALGIRTETRVEAREKLGDVQSIINRALDSGGR